MTNSAFSVIAQQLCALLDEQMRTICVCGLSDLDADQREAYEKRRAKIAILQSALKPN